MKKIVGISLFIFLVAVTSIIAIGFFFSPENPIKPELGSFLPEGAGLIILSTQETAKHNSQADCWTIINGKVYNLTNYLSRHPGSASTIIPYCGKDGSQGFATKDKGNPQSHSSYANSLLTDYYLGILGQEINQSSAPSGNISTPTPIPSTVVTGPGTDITLNSQEISKHNSIRNCWLIISGKVYNVTSYLGAHPGGSSAIALYCGKDGAQAFKGLPHSSYASGLLANYYIGDLDQIIGSAQFQQNIQNTGEITPPPRREQEDNEEDDD